MVKFLCLMVTAITLFACGEGTLDSDRADPRADARMGAGGAGGTGGSGGAPGSDAGADAWTGPRADAAVEPGAEFIPAAPTMYRLTQSQYRNTVRDLLGAVEMPADLEEDTPLHGFASVGASEVTVSPLAVEQYETAAQALMAQVFQADRVAFTGCDNPDAACARAFLARFGRRAWRRPLTEEELTLFVGLATQLGDDLQDAWRGLQFAAAGLLQAPDFVFRIEHGEEAREGERRYTSYEMAGRLSFLLWNTTPDDLLLDAAERGELVTDEGLRTQAERLLADPRARETVRAYFGEYFTLGRLDTLEKDRALYPQMSPTMGKSMRTEVERVIDHLIFEEDTDLRELVSTRNTFVNAELASLYNLPAVEEAGFVPVELPANGPRAGLMGMGGMLALNAHNTVTSPTHRGKFIQNHLLCVDIPPPPPGTVTNLEEIPDEGPITTREKLARHASDPVCAGCHMFMDPLGLALENFDPIGAWRTTENGLPIDASSEIDGVRFTGARELGELLREWEGIGPCMSRRLFRHATGQLEGPDQAPAVAALAEAFAADGHRFQSLLISLVLSEGFRRAGAVQ